MNLIISQALATGLPVITTNHSGLPDQVKDCVNGYLVPEADPTSLAKAIERFIDSTSDWSLMSKGARDWVSANFDQKSLLDRQLTFYQRLVEGHN